MRKKIQILTVILFIGFLSFIGFKTLKDEKSSYSYYEFRELSSRPEITKSNLTNGEFTKEFETFFQDQFYKRIGLSTYYYKFQSVLNKPVISTALIGENDWAISEPTSEFNEQASIDKSINEITQINKFATENNIPLYLSISPNKDYILSDLFPDHPDENAGFEIRDNVLNGLGPEIKTINSSEYFQETLTLEDIKKMYYKTDHHWNYLGAHYNYANLMNTLHNLHPEIPKPLKKEELIEVCADRNSAYFLGSTNRTVLRILDESSEPVCTYTVKTDDVFSEIRGIDLTGKETNNIFNTGVSSSIITYSGLSTDDFAEIVVKTKVKPNNLNVLIIKDSYTNGMLPYIATHFSETHILDMRRYKDGSAYDYIKENNINFIILSHRDTMIGGAFNYSGK